MWAGCKWEGNNMFGPDLLADSCDFPVLIVDGDLAQSPFPVWFEPSNSSKRLEALGQCKNPDGSELLSRSGPVAQVVSRCSGWRCPGPVGCEGLASLDGV